jgi:hypothetical protein
MSRRFRSRVNFFYFTREDRKTMTRWQRVLLLIGVTMLLGFHPAGGQTDPWWSVKTLLENQEKLGRTLQVQDVYKLLYEGSLGVAHLLNDTAEARRSLLQECTALDTVDGGGPLIERISLDGTIVRINLRPFKRLGLSPGTLFDVMVRTALVFTPDTSDFLHGWNEFVALVRYGLLDYPRGDVETWDSRVQRGELPVVHHSPEYVRAYRPAYRVVAVEEFRRIFPTEAASP